MRFHYDKQSDSFYIRFHEGHYKESDEVEDGIIFDYDRAGKLIGIEVLRASKRLPPAFYTQLGRSKLPASFSIPQTALTAPR